LNNYEPGNKFGDEEFDDAQKEYLAVRRKLLKGRIVPYLHKWNRVNDEINELLDMKIYEKVNPMLASSELVDLVLGPEKRVVSREEDV